MKKLTLVVLTIAISLHAFGQRLENVYLDAKDSTLNMYTAVIPENIPVKGFMFLIDGFGGQSILQETDLPMQAARQGILTILPILKTGVLSFGVDDASQASLHEQIESVVSKYHLQGKDFYIGGFSIGGSCAVKYAEMAVKNNYKVKPAAVFAVDPPLDFERFYNTAKRVVRISANKKINDEVPYMIDRIEKEMKGTPSAAIENYYNTSPYSYSDTTQRAVKLLINTPVMMITEPDIQWWLAQRGYDYTYINVTDLAAFINELQRLGNNKAVLVTTDNKGYRKPNNVRHPHSWSIAEPGAVIKWLTSQK